MKRNDCSTPWSSLDSLIVALIRAINHRDELLAAALALDELAVALGKPPATSIMRARAEGEADRPPAVEPVALEGAVASEAG